jgi:hypothetical protein
MSDQSIALSNESPNRSPPQSLPVSPAPASPALTAVDPPGGEVPPPLTPTFRLTRVVEDENHDPVSPGTAETILRLAPEGTDVTILATAFGLASTVYERTRQYTVQLAESQQRITELERVVGAREADNRQLRARLGLLSVPAGFERNGGRISTRVPTGDGGLVVPEWFRSVGDGTVELLAGRQPGEPTYVAELFLRPNHTQNTVTETAPSWFLALLCTRDGGFHDLVEEVRRLDNPAAVAEVYRYRDLEAERDDLVAQQNLLQDQLSSVRDRIDACRYRLEAGQIPHLMRHLEGRNSFVPRPTPQLGRRRRVRVRTVDDGAST